MAWPRPWVENFSPKQARNFTPTVDVCMPVSFQQVTIVGVGLMGGSLGLLLKQQGLARQVVGVGRSLDNLELAVSLGAIDRFECEPSKALNGTDLVVLATPVESYAAQVRQWGTLLQPGTIVSDVGSVKGPLVEQMESLLPPEVHFVGAHPIAGKEKSGVGASTVDLFRGARCILTPTARTEPTALAHIKDLWLAAGSRVTTMDPFLHDWILGAVSHLPHVVAFTLINALTDLQGQFPETEPLLNYGGGGLRDTTRIAGSSPEMWRDICLWNRDNLLTMLETYEQHLGEFKQLLKDRDAGGLEKLMMRAKNTRDKLS